MFLTETESVSFIENEWNSGEQGFPLDYFLKNLFFFITSLFLQFNDFILTLGLNKHFLSPTATFLKKLHDHKTIEYYTLNPTLQVMYMG